jgi:HTH-type transcriptional regulator/antitoxin HigA
MSSLNNFQPDYAPAPGLLLVEHREANLLTQNELAIRLGLDKKTVNQIENGHHPITTETALKLETVMGLPAHIWSGLEARYREFEQRKRALEAMLLESAWINTIGYQALAKLGWVKNASKPTDKVDELRQFFRVSTLDCLPKVWADTNAAYRKSEHYKSKEWLILSWLTQAEREADSIQCESYDASKLKQSLEPIKALSKLEFADAKRKLIERCGQCGIALVLLAAPVGASVCGATRWLTKDRVLVQLSSRFKRDDQFWFSLFHELGHVLLHNKKTSFIDFYGQDGAKNEEERQADDFAAKQLVSDKALEKVKSSRDFSALTIKKQALELGIAPGILVGRLQHEKCIGFNSPLNSLKKPISF